MAKKIGVIGGSGIYEVEGLEDVKTVSVDTPFGKPTSDITTGKLNGVEMAFLPRHGKGHVFSPTEVNYRANIFALKKLGVTHVVSVSAVGSMKEEFKPGDFVVVDQYIDRTKGVRPSTFFENGIVGHVSFGDPVCSELSGWVYEAAQNLGKTIHKNGTYVCMEGPQFSTRAESNLYRSWGVDIIGMTSIPESKLAREAELCYATLALVTDYDCWKEDEEDVSVEAVLETLKNNAAAAKQFVKALPSFVKDTKTCSCDDTLKFALITNREMIPESKKEELKPIIGKYFE